ncbi:sigma-70 family RNA polymerase sigma factor [Mucilaginibacter sp. Bleaf8]|uniref:hypothetical protein n=1 Tax=Mucilaginibacter sp. Bleaf8 TaxID=2834430 RepID=UPI001BCB9E5D|nr:hypothetical protein [Mucilaginibacter sp. Bleaf8]MBS7563646.1 sigma-70 family RNA polymerase sigma factor [Mucilaginibacter sp. Bleaf8]
MELRVENQKVLTANDVTATRALYDRYGNLLLGYITKVVNDRKLAEEYLVDIFKEIPFRLSEFSQNQGNAWLRLQMIAKQKLAGCARAQQEHALTNSIKATGRGDEFLSLMNEQQRFVFCGIYYYQQPVSWLAQELGTTANDIRKILREAFKVIRNGKSYTELY